MKPLDTRCPTCQAAPGSICRDLARGGYDRFPMEIHHKSRIEQALGPNARVESALDSIARWDTLRYGDRA
jgi:hypothetical protein